jgi:iduronate 2-sulfatase
MATVRQALSVRDIDKDGRVWDFGDVVRCAQAALVRRDAGAALVTTTDNYGYSDKWHYDTVGYIDLGRQFAEALHRLEMQAN